MVMHRRRTLEAGNKGLPTDYVLSETISTEGSTSSRGTINTNGLITIGNNFGFEVDVQCWNAFSSTPRQWSGYGCIMGTRVTAGSKDLQLTTYTTAANAWNGSLRIGGTSNYFNAHLPLRTRTKVSLIGNIYTVDGTEYTVSRGDIESNVPIVIGALNQNGTITQVSNSTFRVIKFYNGTDLAHDLVPCVRNSDDRAGLYDLIGGFFIAGTVQGIYTPVQHENALQWEDGVAYSNVRIVNNQYCQSSNGAFISYDGWNRTYFLPCRGAKTITFPPLPEENNGGCGSNYFFTNYRAPKTKIVLSRTEATTVTVPSDAEWFVISSDASALASCIGDGIVPHAS